MYDNENSNGLTDSSWNQDSSIVQELQYSQLHRHHHQQQQQQKKKNHGNRKRQRYRRKLRNQGISPDAIVSLTNAWVDIDSRKSNKVHMQKMETATIAKQQRTIERTNKKFHHCVHMSEVNLSIRIQSLKNTRMSTDHSLDYADVLDPIMSQMLSTAFDSNTNKLDHFLNEKEKMDLVRHYTALIGRSSYMKLQEQQWNWYHHIGMTQNIWTGRIPKHLGEKNSICYTYGRSKKFIEQRRKKIQQQLQQAQHAIQLFEQQILLKAAQHTDCSSEMKILSSIIYSFVDENQQKLRAKFEYKRQMLIVDATDHHLVQAFFNLKPNKTQITSARRIWKATAKETVISEQTAILEHRLISKQLPPASTLFDQMINNIDGIVSESNDINEQPRLTTSSSQQSEKMEQLKHDIIHQSIITGREMIESCKKVALEEKRKYSINENGNDYLQENHSMVINAIETRQSHMIQRAKYTTNHKLATYFL